MFGECHAHLMMNGYDYRKAVELHKGHVNDQAIRDAFSAYQKNDIHFVRDGGDRLGVSKRAMELAKEYDIEYRTPVFAIFKKGYYGVVVGRSFTNMKEYEELVKTAISEGAHFIKIMISGIMDFNQAGVLSCPALPEEDIAEMIKIAHAYGLSVMAHANGDDAVSVAAKNGIDSIEHGNFISPETLQIMAENNCIFVPTAVTIGNLLRSDRFPHDQVKENLEMARKNIKLAYQYHVTTALGSDAGAFQVPHGTGLLDEYQLFQDTLLCETISLDDLNKWLTEGEKAIQCRF